jgi:hypothetical protein
MTGRDGTGCARCGFQRALTRAHHDWAAAPAPPDADADPLARVRAVLRGRPPAPASPPLALMILRLNRVALLLAAAGMAAGVYYYRDASRGELLQLAAADPGSVWSIP